MEIETAGLSQQQVDATMEDYLPRIRECVPDRSTVKGKLEAWLTVAPSGIVSRVEVTTVGNLPMEVVACAQTRLWKATFPAHDLEEGYRFGYVFRVGE